MGISSRDMRIEETDQEKQRGLVHLFTPWRIKWYPRFLLFGVALGYIIAVIFGSGASTLTGRLGGDYPAFYGAGKIIAEGNGRNLYSQDEQHKAQEGLFPGKTTEYLPFVYPPFVALAYMPFSMLNYRVSFILHTVMLTCFLLLTIHLLRPMVNGINNYFLCIFTIALLFYPIFRSVVGGHNTVITMLFIALTWRLVLNKHDFLAGIFLGLLLYKPQFGLPLIGLFFLSGKFRVLSSCLLTAMALWGIGVWMQGFEWVTSWLNWVIWFSNIDAGVNYKNAISWLGFSEGIFGSGNSFALILGWGMTFLSIALLSRFWWAGRAQVDLSARIGITMPFLVAISPHAMYYDLGLLFFTYSIFLDKGIKQPITLIILVWFFGFSQIIADVLCFSPLFFMLVFTLIFALFNLYKPSCNLKVD